MVENTVARYYSHGSLEKAILQALMAMRRDVDVEHLDAAELAPVDEFHIGGLQATMELAERMQLGRGQRLLDIGCALGGPARYFAGRHECHVTGIDLVPEYIDVARSLSRRTGLDARTTYHVGSGLQLPFEAQSFDAATQIHVGMNVEDKERLFAEVHRVLKPGGVFAIFDVMRTMAGEISYPVPWAASAETNFLDDVPTYRRLLEGAGFRIEAERNRGDFAIEFFRRLIQAQQSQGGGPPPLGLHLLMGPHARDKLKNMMAHVEARIVAPIELICRT